MRTRTKASKTGGLVAEKPPAFGQPLLSAFVDSVQRLINQKNELSSSVCELRAATGMLLTGFVFLKWHSRSSLAVSNDRNDSTHADVSKQENSISGETNSLNENDFELTKIVVRETDPVNMGVSKPGKVIVGETSSFNANVSKPGKGIVGETNSLNANVSKPGKGIVGETLSINANVSKPGKGIVGETLSINANVSKPGKGIAGETNSLNANVSKPGKGIVGETNSLNANVSKPGRGIVGETISLNANVSELEKDISREANSLNANDSIIQKMMRFFRCVYGETSFGFENRDVEAVYEELTCIAASCGATLQSGIFDELDSSALSALYEHVLHFHPVVDPVTNLFALVENNSEKKKQGSFYTPDGLAKLAVEAAIEPLLAGKSSEQILKLRILDPSCGGGAFLVAVLNYLITALERLCDVHANVTHKSFLDQVLTSCLYGVDLDEIAVLLARHTLFLASDTLDAEGCYELLRNRIKCGNALIGGFADADTLARVKSSEHSSTFDLKTELDFWCAMKIWVKPTISANELRSPSAELLAEVRAISDSLSFFHWQLEFPEVFGEAAGFDGIVGNPPWEIHKPNSREFFSRYDPNYWEYGKQLALTRQQEICAEHPGALEQWQTYTLNFDEFRRWVKHSSIGLNSTVETVGTKALRPFRHQGRSDLNGYKLFLEQSIFLLRNDGVLAFVVPSSIYSDLGATELRKHFLYDCRWLSVHGFENSAGLFEIHRSFKFCIITVQKGGSTEVVSTVFHLRSPEEKFELLDYSKVLVSKFSPSTISLLEFGKRRDIELMEKLYDNNEVLSQSDWKTNYVREFDMTNDSHLFHLRTNLEGAGYVSDEYGNWLLGAWKKASASEVLADDRTDVIYSHDHSLVVETAAVEDLALPLYEGRMVGQFDFSEKAWRSGKGRRAVWSELPSTDKVILPQYLVRACHYPQRFNSEPLKLAFLGVGSPTNARSMIASALDSAPCGNAVPVLKMESSIDALLLSACFNSYVFDYALRCRLSGNNLNYFLVAETPVLSNRILSEHKEIAGLVAGLNLNHLRFAAIWKELRQFNAFEKHGFDWIEEANLRKDARAVLDAIVAKLFGFDRVDLAWILRGPTARDRNTKGLWRADSKVSESLRQTDKTLRYFEELNSSNSIESFFAYRKPHSPPISRRLDIHAARQKSLIEHVASSLIVLNPIEAVPTL